MVANIRGYTPNYGFKLINFDTPRWHTLEYANWQQLDSMFLQFGASGIRGEWLNSTEYLVGERVFDVTNGLIYRCLVQHVSAPTGSFADDRLAHPTYWSIQLGGVPVYRGDWVAGTVYSIGDIVVVNDYEHFLCTNPHVAEAPFPGNGPLWQTIFDATEVVTDAEAAKEAAQTSAESAASAASNAQSSENDAKDAADEAENWADDARSAQSAFRWAFSTGTAIEDPTTGRVAFNNAIPASVTQICISANSGEAGNPDVSPWIVTWDDSTNTAVRGTIQIRKVGAPEQFAIFDVIGSIIDNGSWLTIPVTYVSHSGALINGDPLSVGFIRAGDAGISGGGGGDMLSTRNLSDVQSPATSRNNLGLGTAQVPTFSQALLTSPPTSDTHAATKAYVDSSPALYISIDPPGSALPNSMWWESDTGTLYVYYNDGNSTQWVQAVAIPNTANFVNRTGDTMTGALALVGDPSLALQAAPKQYVDAVKVNAASLDALAHNGIQINGGMEVSQERGDNNFTGVNGYIVDGWSVARSGTMETNSKQFDNGLTLPGIPKCVGILTTVAQASIGADDYVQLYQPIEGYRTSRLAWGTASAKSITIGFWSAHKRTGIYSVAIGNGSKSYVATYTQNVSSVFEFKTIIVPGCTTGTWETTNATSLSISFMMACGSTYRTATQNTWLNGAYLAASTQINGIAALTDTFIITGVVILPGSYTLTAAQSPLLMRPYDQELRICQRYFEWCPFSLYFTPFAVGHVHSCTVRFVVDKRVLPFLGPILDDPTASTNAGNNVQSANRSAESPTGCNIELTAAETSSSSYMFGRRFSVDARL